MKVHLKTDLASALALVLLWTACTPQEEPYRVPEGVSVERYQVELTVNPASLEIEGTVRFSVHHPDRLTDLPLLVGRGLTIDSIAVNGRATEVQREQEQLLLPLQASDDATLVFIAYHGTPEEGLYADRHRGERVVYTDSWPYRGQGWLPALHHPAVPAALELTLRHPTGWQPVASGMPLASDTLDAYVRSRWRLEAPAPTYSYAFALADYREVSDTARSAAVPIYHYLLPEDTARAGVLDRTPEMVDFLHERIGPYAFGRYASAQVPFAWAGMENAGLGFLQAALLEESPQAAERTQMHEVAHQWFGNTVTIADWRELWLSEGMATYLTSLFYEEAEGQDRARELWLEMAALSEDEMQVLRPLVPEGPVDPDEHLDWLPYRKGGAVLHLLRRRLGDEGFFSALRAAYERHAEEPFTSEAWRQILEEQTGQSLQTFFDVWVYREALPVLHTRWDPEQRRLRWEVTGDGGTLEDVPWELAVQQGNTTLYVDAGAGIVELDSFSEPIVQPVGVMLQVERE